MLEQHDANIDELIDMTMDGRYGIAHPKVLPPGQLMKQLKNLSKELVIPLQLDGLHYLDLIEMSDLHVCCSGDKLVHVLKIPVNADRHELEKITPISTPYDGMYAIVMFPSEYVARNNYTLHYVTNLAVRDAKHVDGQYFMRKQFLEYTMSMRVDACTSALLLGKSLVEQHCDIRKLHLAKTYWLPLERGNE